MCRPARQILTGLLLLAACAFCAASAADLGGSADAGSPRSTLTLENRYAESIFFSELRLDDGEWQTWLSDRRLEMFESASRDIEHESGASLAVRFTVTSVGETNDFEFFDLMLGYSRELAFVYDLDSATLDFRIEVER